MWLLTAFMWFIAALCVAGVLMFIFGGLLLARDEVKAVRVIAANDRR